MLLGFVSHKQCDKQNILIVLMLFMFFDLLWIGLLRSQRIIISVVKYHDRYLRTVGSYPTSHFLDSMPDGVLSHS